MVLVAARGALWCPKASRVSEEKLLISVALKRVSERQKRRDAERETQGENYSDHSRDFATPVYESLI